MRDPIIRHRLKIAHDTMRLGCNFARILGGMNHVEAIDVIRDLTGAVVYVPEPCACEPWGRNRRLVACPTCGEPDSLNYEEADAGHACPECMGEGQT